MKCGNQPADMSLILRQFRYRPLTLTAAIATFALNGA
jgi:hypothetical protein